jgi:O-antigen/teichoic acid export membrane protein
VVVVLLVCVGVLAGVELILAREALVELLYGDEYGASVGILAVLALSVPIFYADIALVWIAYARGKETRVALLGALALVTNVALNVVLIRELGSIGAAIATVVTEAVIAVGYALTLGAHRREHRARVARLLATGALYAGPLLAFATLCVAAELPWAASCLAAAGMGAVLLALPYQREVASPGAAVR